MATKLGIYNGSLRLIGQASLSTLTDAVESRRVLDGVYDTSVQYCLEQGLWTWAERMVKMVEDDAQDPAFGYTSAFGKPSDMIRVSGIWTDADEWTPIIEYSIEREWIYANVTPIYLKYISNNANYGLNLSLWPATFTKYVEAHLAAEICERLTQNASKQIELRELEERRYREANNRNVMEKPARFPPPGSWVSSRYSWGRSSSLRGTRRGL